MQSHENRQRRNVAGVLLLDKPVGLTSNAALQQVKRLYQAKKAGHTGSLDPLASGLLPICFGEATKISGFLLDADKSYHFICQLGVTTRTGDAEGEVQQRCAVPDFDRAQIEKVLARFRGQIEQLPPMYSALKHQGKRLYELARQGIEVERQPRVVTISELTLLNLNSDRNCLECEVRCSKGTYIRTLAEDIGAALGCGAHISQLRRTSVAPYVSDKMFSMAALQQLAEQGLGALDKLLLPIDSALCVWPVLNAGKEAAFALRNGNAVHLAQTPKAGWVRIYDEQQRFFAVAEIQLDGRVAPRRIFTV